MTSSLITDEIAALIDPDDMKIVGDWLEGERGPAPGGRVKGLWQSCRAILAMRSSAPPVMGMEEAIESLQSNLKWAEDHGNDRVVVDLSDLRLLLSTPLVTGRE